MSEEIQDYKQCPPSAKGEEEAGGDHSSGNKGQQSHLVPKEIK